MSNIIRVTKIFHFEMAHALDGHDGLCQHIHGHSYVLEVCLIGSPDPNPQSPKQGMVMDFADLKQIINKLIISKLDHALVVRQDSDSHKHLTCGPCTRIVAVPFQPTCENMLPYFAALLKNALPQGVALHHLRLHETASAFAEWYASDNAQ